MSGKAASERDTQNVRLNAALASWQQWPLNLAAKPKVVRPLSAGLTNTSYLLQAQIKGETKAQSTLENFFKLRLNTKHKTALGINRNNEISLLKQLEGKGITPSMRYYNANEDFCVFDYIEGRVWTSSDSQNPSQRQRLALLIERYQSIPVTSVSINYHLHLQHYKQQLETLAPQAAQQLSKPLTKFLEELEDFMAQNWRPVLCHHDLIPENIVENSKGLTLLDWEYAALGHAEFDKKHLQFYSSDKLGHELENIYEGDVLERLICWLVVLWNTINKNS